MVVPSLCFRRDGGLPHVLRVPPPLGHTRTGSLEIKQPAQSHTQMQCAVTHSQLHGYTTAQGCSHTHEASQSSQRQPHNCHVLKTASSPSCSMLTTGLIAHGPTTSHLVSHSTPTSAHPAPQLGSSCSKSLLFFLSLFFFPPFPSEKPGPCQETQALPYSGPKARQE